MRDIYTKQRQAFIRAIGKREPDTLISIVCGVIFAGLCVTFFI